MVSTSKTALTLSSWRWSQMYTAGIVPGCRHVHTAVIYKDEMFVYGGYEFQHLNDLHAFDFHTRLWRRIPLKGFPPRRHSHSAVVYKDSMYVFGGIGPDSERYNDIHRFDFSTETWSQVVPRGLSPDGRWGHRACVYENRMIVSFGMGQRMLNDVWAYSFDENEWEQLRTIGVLPFSRQYHVAVMVGSKMFIAGGYSSIRQLGDVLCLDLRYNSWRKLFASAHCSRRGHSAVVHENTIYVFGGNRRGVRQSQMLYLPIESEELSEPGMDWRLLDVHGFQPPPRQMHTCVLYGNSVYMFAGLSGRNTNDMYRFCFEASPEDTVLDQLPANLATSSLSMALKVD